LSDVKCFLRLRSFQIKEKPEAFCFSRATSDSAQPQPKIFMTTQFYQCTRALLCALILFTASAVAQNPTTISGRITDPQGAGLATATVTLYERERPQARFSTATNDAGEYRFARVAPGEYIIEAEAQGFTRAAARTFRVAPNASVSALDISLEIAGVQEQVVVTAAGTPQSVDEISKAITVVGRAEIEARDEFSVADALRTVPGLRVVQSGSFGRFVAIRTRGLRTQDTAVLIDGQRFRDAAAITGDASSFLGDLLVTNLDSIEVLRGSGSSLYGTNAIGGVVQIRTDEGGGKTRGNLFAEGGNFGFLRAGAQLAGGAGRDDRFIYSAGISHLNVSRGVDRDDAARNTNAHGRALFRLTPTTSLSARIYAGDAFTQLNSTPVPVGTLPATGIVRARPLTQSEVARLIGGASASSLNTGDATFISDLNDPDASQATRFFAGSFLLTGRPRANFGYTISYQTLATNRATSNGTSGVQDFTLGIFQPFGGATRTDFDGRIQTFNARTDFRLGRHNLITAGYEFENENFQNLSTSPNSRSTVDATERSHTFFVQDQLRFLDERLQLSAAFRVQSFRDRRPRFTGASVEPYATVTLDNPPTAYTGDGSVAYLFRATDTKIRAHVGNGYRAPSLFQRFGTTFFGGSFTVIGEPALRPERSIAVDAGLRPKLFPRPRARLRDLLLHAPARSHRFRRSRLAARHTATFRRISEHRRRTRARRRTQHDPCAHAHARPLTSYTFTNSDSRTPQAGGIISSYVIPDHQFTFVATNRFTDRFLVNLDFNASSDYLAPLGFPTRVFEFDGALRLDLGASYTLPVGERNSFRFFGKVDNLLDRDRYENGFRLPGAALRAGTAFRF
jgi:iron complex outermembrane receptor protein